MVKKRREKEFRCFHCKCLVAPPNNIGTRNRNHCPNCLWSLHLDLKSSGDRKSECKGLMMPIGLTFKKEGKDKYGKPRQGEIMIIHKCLNCGKLSINRIAGDDSNSAIMNLFEKSQKIDSRLLKEIKKEKIKLLKEKDRKEINAQLFGNL